MYEKYEAVGFLAADAETKTASSGTTYTNLRIGVRGWDGTKRETTTEWRNVTAFGKLGEFASRLKKGEIVFVCGRLDIRVGQDGRVHLTCIAGDVVQCSTRKQREEMGFAGNEGQGAGSADYTPRKATAVTAEPAWDSTEVPF